MEWKTRRKLVDVETGEVIKEKDAYKYIIIKKTRNATQNKTTGKGVIEYTIECRRAERVQGKLF